MVDVVYPEVQNHDVENYQLNRKLRVVVSVVPIRLCTEIEDRETVFDVTAPIKTVDIERVVGVYLDTEPDHGCPFIFL